MFENCWESSLVSHIIFINQTDRSSSTFSNTQNAVHLTLMKWKIEKTLIECLKI
jgi:hypothetical protein